MGFLALRLHDDIHLHHPYDGHVLEVTDVGTARLVVFAVHIFVVLVPA